MVDTRRLEKLMSVTTPAATGESGAARRSLALSGHRDMRRAGLGRTRTAQRQAVIDANWDAMARCAPDPAPEKAVHQFNAQVLKSDIVERFDLLRAQLVQQFRSRNLISLGIAGPTAENGATFGVAGLLAAMARRGDQRVIGLDLSLRGPALHKYFEVEADHSVLDFLNGEIPAETYLRRLTANVALGLGTSLLAAEAMQGFSSQDLALCLTDLMTNYAPDMIICDLPPLLQGDTALEICGQLDAVLVIADSRRTRAEEVLACERLLTGHTEFLGVILNHYTGGAQP